MVRKRIVLGGALWLAAAAFILAGVFHALGGTARAELGVTVTTLAIDMDPYDTPANDDDTVGSIDSCVTVAPGSVIDVDVVLDAIPDFGGIRVNDFNAYTYQLAFPQDQVKITGQEHRTSGANLIARAPASIPHDQSEPVPDTGTPHLVVVVDYGTAEGSGDNSWFGGVLGRYEVTVLGTAGAGLYGLSLASPQVADSNSQPMWDIPGNGNDDDDDGQADEDKLVDSNTSGGVYGLIAVDVYCPLVLRAVGGMAAYPDVSESSGESAGSLGTGCGSSGSDYIP